MRNITYPCLLATALSVALNGCAKTPSPASTIEIHTAALIMSTPTAVAPTPTLEPTLPPMPATIHEGNTFPKFSLHPKQSGELEDNRMGAFAGGLTGGGWKPGEPWDYDWMANQVVSRGLKRFRVSIDNLDANSADLDWSIPQLYIDPSHDALISLLAKNDVTMTYVLTFWDKDT